MAKIFMISSGAYSDYGIVCAFTKREHAELWVAAHQSQARSQWRGDAYEIEELSLDEEVEELHPGRTMFWLEMLPDGTVTRTYDVVRQNTFEGQEVPGATEYRIYATDLQHAIKIANERRIINIATAQRFSGMKWGVG